MKTNFRDSWKQIATLPGENYQAISWFGKDGVLLAAEKNLISVLTKWSNIFSGNENERISKSPQNYMKLSTQNNELLPDYHPKILIENLLWGKFERVNSYFLFYYSYYLI